MLNSIRDRIPSPKFSNPFPTCLAGEAIYTRLLSIPLDEREDEFNQLDDDAKEAYRTYLRGRDNRDVFWRLTGVAFVGAAVTGVLVALSSEDDGEEYEEDEDEIEDEIDDEDIDDAD